MNCRDFDAILLELVRGQAAGLAMEEGRAHAAGCARCAALFSEQRRLSVGLEALAARADQDRPPERIESALRAEFRRQHARAPRPGVYRWQGASARSSFRLFWNRRAWALAAIAIALAGGLIGARFLKKPGVTPLTQSQPQRAAQPGTALPPAVAAANPQLLSGHAATRSAAKQGVSHPRALARSRAASTHEQASRDEWATNFYPLPYGSGLGLDEGWEMVRVNMPVSALASLGVPMTNGGPSVHYVKADVVLGGDGMARAIRFIH
jgi:hypothetical protein